MGHKEPRAESLDLTPVQGWRKVAGRMISPRYMFTPCVFQDDVYLCGGETRLIEVFSLSTQTFHATEFLLLPEESSTVAWVEDGQLTVISKGKTTRVRLTEKQPRAEVESHPYEVVCANCTPVKYDRKLWWMRWDKCLAVELGARPMAVTIL